MLRAAALVPPTILLAVPFADAAFDQVRRDARVVVERLVASVPGRVVIIGPDVSQARSSTAGVAISLRGAMHPTFRAAGIDDDTSGLAGLVVGTRTGAPTEVDDVPAAVALALLAQVGWAGEVEVVGARGPEAKALRAVGRALAEDDIALLLVGGLSARRGPAAPLAEDPRAAEVDTVIAADLGRLGRPGDPAAAARLAAFDPALARDLAISAWAPWQVLLGALEPGGPALSASARASVPSGATYAVVGWGQP